MLATCPRCGSYVAPDWQLCKICGFDPENPQTHTPFTHEVATTSRLTPLEVLGALATLAVIVLVVVGSIKVGVYLWQHRSAAPARQEFVTLPHQG